jgi:hypothetical protein
MMLAAMFLWTEKRLYFNTTSWSGEEKVRTLSVPFDNWKA